MTTASADDSPRSSLGMPLVALIMVAAVANLNLAVANVALPSIGQAFDASQTALNMIAIGFSLGLAASVLYLGALGDRYGRKGILLTGVILSIPASLLAGFAWNEWVLAGARIFGGVAAGMAYPTTLALITAIWTGANRTKAIALWSAIGGGVMSLAPLVSGVLLLSRPWGSVFLITLPLAIIALVLALKYVPAHLDESTEPVDHLGGVLSVIMVATLVISINFAPVPGAMRYAAILFGVTVVAALLFVRRQRTAPNPLYDLKVARRRVFWVAAVGGMIVFGSLMGAMFIGQQYLQNVLGYDTALAGVAPLPAAIAMVLVAGLSAKFVENRGSRLTLLLGFGILFVGFVLMLVLWQESTGLAAVLVTYLVCGFGVGFAGTPASRSLTNSVPVDRAGMASATADLQRDLGGAVMQAVLGALLTAGYASSMGKQVAAAPEPVSQDVVAELQKSFASATETAQQYPQYATAIVQAAKEAFLAGANWAYAAGVVFVGIGALLIRWRFPGATEENELIASYQREDEGAPA
ncbi:MAG: MFS transporter [Candidatus Nanopelagicales bacterium]